MFRAVVDRDTRYEGIFVLGVRTTGIFCRPGFAARWARRLAQALGRLSRGAPVSRTAFESGYDSLSGFTAALRNLTGRPPSRTRDAMVVQLTRLPTPLGPMLLGATDDAVCLLEFTDRRMLEAQLRRLERGLGSLFIPGTPPPAAQLMEELEAYFRGGLKTFATPLLTPGTHFQRRVWEGLREIPWGQTRSYGELARALGMPDAARAVARANGENRIAIVIPCHRVIGADGRLTGYGGGLERKRWLLELEGSRGAAGQTVLRL